MKIDPYYQRQKCSQGILVSSKVANEGGVLKMAIFASFARYIFRTFTSKVTFIILYYAAH